MTTNIIDFGVGDVVQLQNPKPNYMIVSSVNLTTNMVLVKTSEGPRVYDYKDLKIILDGGNKL